ncbi:MAG: class I SAM-dependent methyltransferase [Firmicutes bacterium]|nr:class I SAM-dependent methyltransferase [Bacillota bacterium]
MGSPGLFDRIALIYALFYKYQVKHFGNVLDGPLRDLTISSYTSAIDVGCGTGALCAVLKQKGLQVTGIDPAGRMLAAAAKRPANKGVDFIRANAAERLPFSDKSFDISFCTFVAHGLPAAERVKMYAELSRITRYKILIIDYNQQRSLAVNIVEWLEGGNYFKFVRQARHEMETYFAALAIRPLGPRTACYICTP